MSRSQTGVELGTRRFKAEAAAAKSTGHLLRVLSATSERLRVRFAPLVGGSGYEALLRRAARLAAKSQPRIAATLTNQRDGSAIEAWQAALAAVDARTARATSATLIEEMLKLWFGFVGEELTMKIVRDVWPDPSDIPSNTQKRRSRR